MEKIKVFDLMIKLGLIWVLLFPQAKSSPVCHPNVRLMREEEKCMKDLLLSTSHKTAENNSVHCKGMWDDLNCWPPAFLGETVSQPCPEFFNSGGKVHRNCTNNGWTDLLIPHEDACGYSFNESLSFLGESSDSHLYFSYVKTMYTVGYTISLISLIIAITIFCVFRKLHCTRNYIHIQLFISFSLRAIFIFIRDALLFTDEEIYHCDHYPVAMDQRLFDETQVLRLNRIKNVLLFCHFFSVKLIQEVLGLSYLSINVGGKGKRKDVVICSFGSE